MTGPRLIGISLLTSILASVGLFVVYLRGGEPQLEGVFLGFALGGLSVGLIAWAKQFLPHSGYVEPHELLHPETEQREMTADAFESGAELITRRKVLSRLLIGAIGALGLAAVLPIRSLGVRPGRELFTTKWRRGIRVVNERNVPVRPEEVSIDAIITVFPEGQVDAADSPVVLIRLPPRSVEASESRRDWAPDGIFGFSKICTHAGCPVGLYQPETRELLCPCHQSVFSVDRGAQPTKGPATRALPQLPLEIDSDGYLRASSDFTEPVGPGFWNRKRA